MIISKKDKDELNALEKQMSDVKTAIREREHMHKIEIAMMKNGLEALRLSYQCKRLKLILVNNHSYTDKELADFEYRTETVDA